ncbi:MAG TPA: Xaa-Pro peptidase family protein [Thermoanaerobaculia bacterium]|jgi:Xaa-Pro aminopeptidase|nr:Xaa-Pro peptidase family protein [Thermoanaerobaculia bacterium]
MLAQRIPEIQSALAEAGFEGWFFNCFQLNDPIGLDLLGLSGEGKLVTRRCYYVIPREGEPRKLVHGLEPATLDHLPGSKTVYTTWQEHRQRFGELVSGFRRLAAQYSPNNELPSVSRIDAGTADLLKAAGIELATSADLAQRFAATWSQEQLEGHRRANVHLHRIVLEAFNRVGDALRRGDQIDEYAVQRFILDSFGQAGLWAEADPIVGINAHSADPHYQPGPDHSSPIQKGDFLLIDLWAKEKAAGSVYADITWCGVCAAAPTDKQQEVFGVVAGARDAAWELVRSRFPGKPVRGFEVDDAAREVIRKAGYGERFIHRTGHSIGISDHGQGANMDNLETHDTRQLLPMTGFSIEPGIYLTDDFGVRLEINVALTEEGAEITGAEPQRELLRLLA